jgi:putative peptide zinc metalloprotease protein
MNPAPGKGDRPFKLQAVRSRADRIAEAITEGLKIPWNGLRQDLVLRKGAPDIGEKETYILEDVVRGVHFELGEAEAQFFLCLATEQNLRDAVNKLLVTSSLRPSTDDIIAFLKMLQREKLAVLPPEISMETARLREGKKLSRVEKITFYRRLFFFMIPLLRPDRILTALYPWVRPLWSPPFVLLYVTLGIVGVVFTVQQMELYLRSVSHLFTPKGALGFFLSIYIVKVLHELGHAFASKHYGVYVRRTGLYMMFFMPMFFTDTTDAWKLPSRKARLMIGAAGVLVELCVACVAIFFWSILPEGMIRSLMFYLSGASLVSTLLTNINPLMRFDGYYLMMDYLRISNLRTRGQEMFKWFRRKILVDWQEEKPEEHPRYRIMAVIGAFTGIYIFVIFMSIGILIFQRLGKVLGAAILTMNVTVMLMLPIILEIGYILKNRDKWGRKSRVLTTFLVIACLIGAVFYPMAASERLPGLFLYADVARVDAPNRGRVASEVPDIGAWVEKGDLLLRLEDDQLEQDLRKTETELDQIRVSIDLIGSGGQQGGYRTWLLAEEARLSASRRKLLEGLSQLEIRAPITGRIAEINETLQPRAYVGQKRYLMTVCDPRNAEVRAYARETLYRDIKDQKILGGAITFYNLETRTLPGRFREMYDFPVNELPNKTLYDYLGGPILSQATESGPVRPRQAHFPMIFDLPNPQANLPHGVRCSVRVDLPRHSLFDRAVQGTTRFLASEGFI